MAAPVVVLAPMMSSVSSFTPAMVERKQLLTAATVITFSATLIESSVELLAGVLLHDVTLTVIAFLH